MLIYNGRTEFNQNDLLRATSRWTTVCIIVSSTAAIIAVHSAPPVSTPHTIVWPVGNIPPSWRSSLPCWIPSWWICYGTAVPLPVCSAASCLTISTTTVFITPFTLISVVAMGTGYVTLVICNIDNWRQSCCQATSSVPVRPTTSCSAISAATVLITPFPYIGTVAMVTGSVSMVMSNIEKWHWRYVAMLCYIEKWHWSCFWATMLIIVRSATPRSAISTRRPATTSQGTPFALSFVATESVPVSSTTSSLA